MSRPLSCWTCCVTMWSKGRRAAASVVPRRGERRLVPLLGESFFVRPDLTVRDGLSGLRSDAAIAEHLGEQRHHPPDR